MRLLTRSCFQVMVLLLAACSASGPVFSDIAPSSADTGRIYVYRSNTLVGAAVTAHVAVDELPPKKLKPRGFVYFDVAPGRHEVAIKSGSGQGADTDQPVIAVLVSAGQAVFAKYANHPTDLSVGAGTNSFDLTEVPTSTGLDEIQDIRLSE